MSASAEHLKTIWFEGEMLPKWAQLLDVAVVCVKFCKLGLAVTG